MYVSVMIHAKQRGGEVIVGSKSHILLWEQGGASQVKFEIIVTITICASNVWCGLLDEFFFFFLKQIAGLQLREVRNLADGTFDMDDFRDKLRPESPDPHEPFTTLVCVENTHNYCGGTILPIEWVDQVNTERIFIFLPLPIYPIQSIFILLFTSVHVSLATTVSSHAFVISSTLITLPASFSLTYFFGGQILELLSILSTVCR